jgi:hypothetical protein
MRRFRSVCLLCAVLIWLSPAASAGQLFYDISGGTTLTAIDISTGVAHTIGTGTGYKDLLSSAFGPDGTFYAMGTTLTGAPAFIKVNLGTGVGTFLGTPPSTAFGLEIASDGTLYSTEGGTLYKGTLGGSPTQVGSGMGFDDFMDFALDSHDALYAVSSLYNANPTGPSKIYRIDTTTGLGTLVGTVNTSCLMGIAFDRSDNLFATEYCGGPWPLYQITSLSASNPNGAIATAIGTSTTVPSLHGGDIYNSPEPASLMLCLLGGALLAARKLHS